MGEESNAPADPAGDDEPPSEPTDQEVVETAAEAAEGVIFSQFRQSDVEDYDVTVTFEEGVLDVDVYINTTDDTGADPDEVVDEAARTAQEAVDELFER